MDYNQEQFFRTQFDVPKMPFYMSYPMQNLYLTEMEYEKDMERMKELEKSKRRRKRRGHGSGTVPGRGTSATGAQTAATAAGRTGKLSAGADRRDA